MTKSRLIKKMIVGYYPVWVHPDLLPVDKIDFSALTHIAVAFISVTKKNLKEYTQIIKQIVKKAYTQNVRVIASVGGGNPKETEAIKTIVSDNNKRKNFVIWLTDYIIKNNIDGLDIDWEFPMSKDDSKNYVKLIKELKKVLNEKGKNKYDEPYYLSIACSPVDYFGKWFDIKNMQKYLDYLHIMTYDYYAFYSDMAGHNSPLYYGFNGKSQDFIEWTMKYWEKQKGAKKEKLLLGLPFYGRKFNSVKDIFDKNIPSNKENAILYKDIIKINNDGWKEIFDKKRCVPYKINKKEKTIIVYDNELSIEKKCEYVIKNNYGGVIIWALGQDRINGKQELLAVVKQKLK